MSYSDPQSWEDVDAGGNACDWTTRKNKLLYPAYEMLRKALIERADFINNRMAETLPSSHWRIVIPASLQNPVTSDSLISKTWKNDFQDVVSGLMNKNSERSYLAYFGFPVPDTGMAPASEIMENNNIGMQSESKYLNVIGDSSRLPVTDIFDSAWEIQQYKFLNVMRYGCYHNTESFIIKYAEYNLYDGTGWHQSSDAFCVKHLSGYNERTRFNLSFASPPAILSGVVYSVIHMSPYLVFSANGTEDINGNSLNDLWSANYKTAIVKAGTLSAGIGLYSPETAQPTVYGGVEGVALAQAELNFQFKDW